MLRRVSVSVFLQAATIALLLEGRKVNYRRFVEDETVGCQWD